ncbi:MAG TPA: (Fe-S)-binding protein [candidate division Zixibacteria bacterium]|nr:(Fe-S)-binding protein [candidate division Zixibacteria bacterium]
MINNVIQTTENCRYCLMCRHVCPIGHVTRKETFTPHGWGLTIASIRRGQLELDEESVAVLYSCADCGTCRAHCVTDQPLPSAIAMMRAEIVEGGLAPAAVSEVGEKLAKWGNAHAEKKTGTPEGTGEVALFVGDDGRYLDDETLPSALKLLATIGIEPVLIGIGRNNGYLASSIGLREAASGLIQKTLEELERSQAKTMLVLGPGDYYTFGQLAEERFGISWPGDIVLLEVSRLLSDHLAAGNVSFNPVPGGMPFAYIDPTHSVRVTSRFDAPRSLVSAIMGRPPIELFWRKERTHPCGNVALQFTEPHLSDHLTYSRLADARQSGAQLLITEDPGTLFHLRKHADKFGLDVQSLYKLLANHIVKA